MMVWAQGDAAKRGFAVDEAGLQEATDFLLADDNRAGIVPNPGEPEREGNPYALLAVYTTLAFREGGAEPSSAAQTVIAKAAAHVLAKQGADGSWTRFEGRPPIMDLQEPATLLAEYTLGPADATAGDEAARRRALTRQWLAANSRGENQQALSLRILVDHERQASVEELLQRQHPDGGWGQSGDMPSDAYATGQAMYALVARGGLDAAHPAIVAARDFLVATQTADGSWLMASRPPNNGGDVDGAGNLEPITVAGAAWAILGLLQVTSNAP
jgi:squalene-hopene/tetraprenyl-beta-curcumene cyclase